MVSCELQGRTMPESLDDPESVVVVDELGDDDTSLVDGLEAVKIKDLLLQRSIEPFDNAVALWTPDEGRRVSRPQELEFALKVV